MTITKTQTVQKTPIEMLEERIEDVRKHQKAAKISHEEAISKARELRDLLARTEKKMMDSEYERLSQVEGELMGTLTKLKAEDSFNRNKGKKLDQ